MKSAAQIAFFLIVLAIGLVVYKDYGISFDEGSQRNTGVVSLKHVVERFAPSLLPSSARSVQSLNEYRDGDYGVVFELPAVALEVVLRIDDKKDVFLFRHLLTFLVALGGVYAVHTMARRRFADWRLGLLAALFLILTPRLFAESFYNSKDIVFMAVFAIAMNTTISFILKPGVGTALLHALATAVAIDVRLMAVILPVATVAISVVRLLKREVPAGRTSGALTIYLAASCLLVPAMWPWLWSDPIGNFVQAFTNMAKFRWEREVLYMGRFIPSTELPWHYILVWISITTPLLYLALFVAGVLATLRRIMSRGIQLWKSDEELQDVVFLGLFAAPIAAVILLQSVLYDGWRQMYFVYPAVLLLALHGWVTLWSGTSVPKIRRSLLGMITAVSLLHTAAWMWQAHPFQNVYFNVLAGKNLRTRYELDYWGLANRKALEYLVANDQSDVINVRADSFTALDMAFTMIDARDRQRLRYSDDRSLPQYVFTNYRLVKDPDDSKYARDYDLFYQIRVDGEVILSVYRHRV